MRAIQEPKQTDVTKDSGFPVEAKIALAVIGSGVIALVLKIAGVI